MSSSFQRSLATGGSESFSIWDSSSYGKIYSQCPSGIGSPIVVQSWSLDGSCLASLPRDSPRILMSYSVKGLLRTSEVPLDVSEVRALSFPKTTNMKSIWIAHQKYISQVTLNNPKILSKNYSLSNLAPKERISCLALNVRDDHAALGTNQGKLLLVNLASGFQTTLSVNEEEMNLNDVRYNNIRHALLGSASDSGTIAFWDVHARKRLSSFKKHASPASGIAFSPVNEMLVLSSGLDKKCICYDAKEKKPVSTIHTEYPLTCVDFKQDGFILALGTSTGQVLIYDLRSFDTPIQDFQAHATFVHSIKYASQYEGKRSSFPKGLPLKDVSVSNNAAVEMSPIALKKGEDSFKDDTLGSTHGFSPLRREYTSSPLELSSVERHRFTPISNNTSVESMFSPLRDSAQSINSTTNASIVVDRGGSFSVPPPLGLIKEESTISSEVSASITTTFPSVPKTTQIKEIISQTSSVINNDLKAFLSPKFDPVEDNKENFETPPMLSKGEPDPLSSNSKEEDVDMRHILTAFPSCLSLADPPTGKTTDSMLPPTHPESFSQAYLGNIVKGTFQDYSREITSLIWSARYESIKMFYELSDKIQDTSIEASSNAALLEENRQLRQEIQNLKSYF